MTVTPLHSPELPLTPAEYTFSSDPRVIEVMVPNADGTWVICVWDNDHCDGGSLLPDLAPERAHRALRELVAMIGGDS